MSERKLREWAESGGGTIVLCNPDDACADCQELYKALAADPDVVAALRKTRAMLDRVNADLAIEPQSIVTHDQLVGMQSALYEIIGWLEKIVRLTDDGWEWTE